MSIEKVFAERANLIPEKKRKEILEAFVATLPTILPFSYAGKVNALMDKFKMVYTPKNYKIVKAIPNVLRGTVFDNNEAVAMMYVGADEFVEKVIEKYEEVKIDKEIVDGADTEEILRVAIIRTTKHFLNEIVEGTR